MSQILRGQRMEQKEHRSRNKVTWLCLAVIELLYGNHIVVQIETSNLTLQNCFKDTIKVHFLKCFQNFIQGNRNPRDVSLSNAAYASIRKRDIPGISISLVVQWLGLGTSTARARVQSLVEELRSCKPLGKAKKKRQTDIPTYTCDLLHPRSLKLEGPQRRWVKDFNQ